ncbi:natterin-3-like isoform X3 [Sylvia atricapilla]|uniref:natterin-3-like isoform X3 n=1 Tax=Sylvia atricapilla TaxID=48155 RepID=UPI003390F403
MAQSHPRISQSILIPSQNIPVHPRISQSILIPSQNIPVLSQLLPNPPQSIPEYLRISQCHPSSSHSPPSPSQFIPFHPSPSCSIPVHPSSIPVHPSPSQSPPSPSHPIPVHPIPSQSIPVPSQSIPVPSQSIPIPSQSHPSPSQSIPVLVPAPSRPVPRRPRSEPTPSWLRWVPFRGQIPADAVSSRNGRSGRTEFICLTPGCHLGSFAPERGPSCVFTWGEAELSSAEFQLLVNPGGFEALDWVDTSFGSVPQGAVRGCPRSDGFVGRSPEGLGKASRVLQALFVAVDGGEMWYKWYQVLVVRQGPGDVSIANVSYNGSAALESSEPVELAEVPVRNEGCQPAPKPVTLEEATEVEHGWSAELPALAATRGVLRAAPLVLTEPAGWDVGNVTAVPWVGAASAAEFVSRLHRVRPEVPARSECSVVLRGLRREIRVPFSAWLTREFRSGRRHRLVIAGWARSRAVTGVRAGLERCRPLRELPPCPH